MTGRTETFDSESAFLTAVDFTLSAAQREIRIFDRDLVRLGLENPTRVALLDRFLAADADHHLRIALHDTAPLEAQMPRLLTMLRDYRHNAEVRCTPPHLRQLAEKCVLADRCTGVIRFHEDRARGKYVLEFPGEIEPWWRRFDDLWQESDPCSPGAVTGL